MSIHENANAQGGIDPDTGEVLSSPTALLDEAARDAANAYVILGKARSNLADRERKLDAFIAFHFPEIYKFREEVARLQREYDLKAGALRAAAMELWQEHPEIGKTLLGGAITIAEPTRVTFYDPAVALDWCEEVRPDLIKKEADKQAIKKLAEQDAEIPSEVMELGVVPETRIREDKLSLLIG